MKRSSIVLVICVLCALMFSCQLPSSANELTYLNWRQQVFLTTPESLGITVEINSQTPYGIVMDHRLTSGDVFTLVSFINGDCSVLTSTNHGELDVCSRYETVQAASEKYVKLAAQYVGRMTFTKEYPLPVNSDDVKFYIITPGGIYTNDEESYSELAGMNNKLFPLFYEANKVISAIREATTK